MAKTKARPKKAGARKSKARRDAVKPPSDQPTFAAARKTRMDVMPGQYFVRVHPGAIRPHVAARTRAKFGPSRMAYSLETAHAVPDGVVEPLKFLRENVGLKEIRPLFAEAGRGRVSSARVSRPLRDRLAIAAAVVTEEDDDLAGIAVATIDPKASAATIRRAQASNAIDFIEPVPARWLAAAGADPMQNLQWGLRAIRWFDAKRPDAGNVTVGVLDTGIDAGHPDFEGVDLEYDHPNTKAEDIVGHGTHVAGIIAAATNNSVGISGVASCAIHAWKIFPDEPIDGDFYVDPDLFADALRSASLAGLSALNMSIGGTQSSRPEQILMRRLADRGVTVVAAMGNEYNEGNPVEFPAAYDDVLAVGSIAETRERSSFSNTGSHIGICAPGSNVLSTLPRRRSDFRDEKGYASWSGTSMATPHVAAGAALVAAKKPKLSGRDLAKHLRKTAAKLPAMQGQASTEEYGSGLLDLPRALR